MSPGNHTSISSVLLMVFLALPAYSIRLEMLLPSTQQEMNSTAKCLFASWGKQDFVEQFQDRERGIKEIRTSHRIERREATPSMLLSSDQIFDHTQGKLEVNPPTCIASGRCECECECECKCRPTGFHALCKLLLTTSRRCMGEGGCHSAPSRC